MPDSPLSPPLDPPVDPPLDPPLDPSATTIDRRRFLAAAGAAGAATVLGGGAPGPPAQADPAAPGAAPGVAKRPNIILILADDIGYSDLGCFGSEIATPHLDRLAAGGRRFTQMYNNARCCPSRASLLTGLYPTQAGVGHMIRDLGVPEYQGYLNDSCVTLADALAAAGYRTSISGKWHVAPWGRTGSLPHSRGFDRSFCPVGGNGYYRPNRYLDGEIIGIPYDDPDFYVTDVITEHATASIREHVATGQPFFSYVSYTAPHWPLHAWPEDIARYRGRYLDGWHRLRAERLERQRGLGVVAPDTALLPPDPAVPSWEDDEHHDWQDARMAVYAAQITAMDRGIGRILATLGSLGITDDTMVLFLGDNGGSAEPIAAGRRSDVPTIDGSPMRDGNTPGVYPGPSDTYASYGRAWASASDTPFRKWKKWMHEGGISTPCVASWPAVLPAGGIDHRPLHLVDLMPTFLDLAGADYPDSHQGRPVTPTEGVSFAEVLANGPAAPAWSRGRPIFWEHQGNRAVRQGRWKLVADHPGDWELYDVRVDRTEAHNLAAARPDMVADLADKWRAWQSRVGVRDWDGRGYRI